MAETKITLTDEQRDALVSTIRYSMRTLERVALDVTEKRSPAKREWAARQLDALDPILDQLTEPLDEIGPAPLPHGPGPDHRR